MFIVSCPVEFFSPSGATSDVPRCRSLRSLGGLFLRNYKHFAPLGLRPQNPLASGNLICLREQLCSHIWLQASPSFLLPVLLRCLFLREVSTKARKRAF